MIREIKFRGKDTMTGEWRFGDLVHNQKVTSTGLEPRVMVGGYEVVPESVGQFTGFYDIHRTEIYEGDILYYENVDYEYETLVVLWRADSGGFFTTPNIEEPDFEFIIPDFSKVAGNIIDDPEKLEGRTKNEE